MCKSLFQNEDVEEEKVLVLIFLAQVATHAFHLTTPDLAMITASDMKIYTGRLQLCFALYVFVISARSVTDLELQLEVTIDDIQVHFHFYTSLRF
jgi:hypothetical protein